MAKISSVQKNKKKKKLVNKYKDKRAVLKAQIYNKALSIEERFAAATALADLPRSSSPTRVRNRCVLTGRVRGVIRKFGLSRNMLRLLAAKGEIPGLIKGSW